ncbi:hypothetical protein RHS01_01544 [Rhizoctonia solani]|uniref:Uncharacterized protein n=1 Tax=Rhizoctonia solani TaxID=456999 RepID=A0A8H7IMR8_9AGAM|nr:hypothetical protein RHS01_01544 [Rhizoctonia solani]
MSSAPPTPEVPKVQQVLHVYAKVGPVMHIGRQQRPSRTGVAPPPSYQSVTVNGVTTLLHLNSRDGQYVPLERRMDGPSPRRSEKVE